MISLTPCKLVYIPFAKAIQKTKRMLFLSLNEAIEAKKRLLLCNLFLASINYFSYNFCHSHIIIVSNRIRRRPTVRYLTVINHLNFNYSMVFSAPSFKTYRNSILGIRRMGWTSWYHSGCFREKYFCHYAHTLFLLVKFLWNTFSIPLDFKLSKLKSIL